MIASETNALLAILMDTPGLKQEQIGPLLRKMAEVYRYAQPPDGRGFYYVIKDMLEAWTG